MAEVIPLSRLVDTKVPIWELQDIGIKCGRCVRVTDIEDSYVHSGCGNHILPASCIVLTVFDPITNSDKLTPSVSVFIGQLRKLHCQIQRH